MFDLSRHDFTEKIRPLECPVFEIYKSKTFVCFFSRAALNSKKVASDISIQLS